jgi:hypothetical protein
MQKLKPGDEVWWRLIDGAWTGGTILSDEGDYWLVRCFYGGTCLLGKSNVPGYC